VQLSSASGGPFRRPRNSLCIKVRSTEEAASRRPYDGAAVLLGALMSASVSQSRQFHEGEGEFEETFVTVLLDPREVCACVIDFAFEQQIHADIGVGFGFPVVGVGRSEQLVRGKPTDSGSIASAKRPRRINMRPMLWCTAGTVGSSARAC